MKPNRITPTNDEESVWSVWRLDENGNVFLVKNGLGKSTALKLVSEFEAKGHKQTYWIKKDLKTPDQGMEND